MPHGGNGAPLETNLRKIANAASVPQHTRQRLAECFEENHRLLKDINQKFSAMGFQIINFFETKETPQLGLVCWARFLHVIGISANLELSLQGCR